MVPPFLVFTRRMLTSVVGKVFSFMVFSFMGVFPTFLYTSHQITATPNIDSENNKYKFKLNYIRKSTPRCASIYFVLIHCVYPPSKLLTTPASPINPSSMKGKYPNVPAGISASNTSCVNWYFVACSSLSSVRVCIRGARIKGIVREGRVPGLLFLFVGGLG